MSAAAETLGTEDYAALHAMQMSADPSERQQASALAKKLTPSEITAFFDYQQSVNKGKGERTREDNSLFGMPPELAAVSAVPIARAVAGAGVSLAGKAAAAASAVGPQVAAQAKYWATKATLTKMGVPPMIAEGIAIVASGLKKGTKVEPQAPAEVPATAGPAAPVASVPAPQGPPTAPVAAPPVPAGPNGGSASLGSPLGSQPSVPSPRPQAPPPEVMQRLSPATAATVAPTGPPAPRIGPDGLLVGRPGGNPEMPDQRALNEAALAARRAAYQQRLAAESAAVTPPAAPVPQKPMLLATEAKEYIRLLNSGKTAKEAMESIQAQRGLRAAGTLTDAERIAAQDARYMRGEVKTPSAETARAQREKR